MHEHTVDGRQLECSATRTLSAWVKWLKWLKLPSKIDSSILQLSIDGIKVSGHMQEEDLDGDNKYDAEQHGMQDAKRRVFLGTLPPVLQLHLLRFQFSYQQGSYKVRAASV